MPVPLLRSATWLVLLIGLPAGWQVSAEENESSFAAAAATVDRWLQESWEAKGIVPVPVSDDAEFCRRVWLDLGGVAPSVWELRSFLRDRSSDKRARLITRLLRGPQHARHMAARWTDVLLPADANPSLGVDANSLERWLQQQFLQDTPYDYLVGEILTAGGSTQSGPAAFFASRSLEPEKLATVTSQIFMGIQLQCAQCHDHPFDDWTQEDFWQYAAFFSQLNQRDGSMPGEMVLTDYVGSEVMLPGTEDIMPPRYPGVARPPEEDPAGNRRRQLTIWLASRDNPYFARAAVNRVWAHLFGRGLVEPIDAMDAGNAPSHPRLLDFLAEYFVQQRFQLDSLYAVLTRTEAYGRSSRLADGSRPTADSFAAMAVKTLSAAQFYDSLQQNVFYRTVPTNGGAATADSLLRQSFLERMRASGSSPQDYPHGVVQALAMMNGPEIAAATDTRQSGLLGFLEAPFFSDDERIEILFMATLSRRPSQDEHQRFREHLANASTADEKRKALGDLLWVLLNTAECTVCP